MRNKKLLTSAVALGLAAVLLLGGTFAWQSIGQIAENETANVVNPGGRLHDDFNGTNKDIYVENFGDEPILARVRLEEYFALVINQGTAFANTELKLGSVTEAGEGDDKTYTYTGKTYVFKNENREGNTFLAGYDKDTDTYRWKWTVGSYDSEEGLYYMPTYNKNKDSLAADVNGWYKNGIGTFGVATTKTVESVVTSRDVEGSQYEGYDTWSAGKDVTKNAIYDIDRNSIDELTEAGLSAADLNSIINGDTGSDKWNSAFDDAVKLVSERHTTKLVGDTYALISMQDWLNSYNDVYKKMSEGDEKDYLLYDLSHCWVYDEDGWVYWSAPIQSGSATGRLLDGIALNGVMDDSWYYAINAVAQFVTLDDLGKDLNDPSDMGNGTGFYGEGEVPSMQAEELLKIITTGEVSYDSDAYVVFYSRTREEYEGSEKTEAYYAAYYIEATSENEAIDKTKSLGDDMDPDDIVYCCKASQVPHDSEFARKTGYVQFGGLGLNGEEDYVGRQFTVVPTDMSGWFKNYGADLEGGVSFNFGKTGEGGLITENVTNMASLFQNVNFAEIGNASYDVEDGHETSNTYKATVDLSGWDTSRVINLLDCFKDSNIEELNVTNWNTGSVTKMAGMFSGCTSLTTLTGAENWNTGSVTDMNNMFFNCYKLTLNCSRWDVSKVLNGYRNQFGKVGNEYKNSNYSDYVVLDSSNSTVNGRIKGITYPSFPGASTT